MESAKVVKECNELSAKAMAKAYEMAEKYYKRKFVRPKLIVKSTTSFAGRYRHCLRQANIDRFAMLGSGGCVVSKNQIIISSHWYHIRGKKKTENTVFHEVAHALTRELFGGTVRSHGPEWKRIMRVVFDRKADRCFTPTVNECIKHINKKHRKKSLARIKKNKDKIITPNKNKSVRTPEQIQADKDKMAKVREARNKKKQQPGGLLNIIKEKIIKPWLN